MVGIVESVVLVGIGYAYIVIGRGQCALSIKKDANMK